MYFSPFAFQPSATKKRMQAVANISVLAMFVMYLLTALFGYLTFYGKALLAPKCQLLCYEWFTYCYYNYWLTYCLTMAHLFVYCIIGFNLTTITNVALTDRLQLISAVTVLSDHC